MCQEQSCETDSWSKQATYLKMLGKSIYFTIFSIQGGFFLYMIKVRENGCFRNKFTFFFCLILFIVILFYRFYLF